MRMKFEDVNRAVEKYLENQPSPAEMLRRAQEVVRVENDEYRYMQERMHYLGPDPDYFREIQQQWLRDIEIGEPIKSWLQPQITVTDSSLSIICKTKDTNPPHHTFQFTFIDYYPLGSIRTKAGFHDMIRRALQRVVTHEVDEALRIEGKQAYNPHDDSTRRHYCKMCGR